MRNVANVALLVAFVATAAAAQGTVRSSGDLDHRFVTELHQNEPWEGHAFHAGRLWVSKSRHTDAEQHRVEVYAPGGSLLQVVNLSHSAREILPFDATSVIALGMQPSPLLSQFSILRVNGAIVTATTTTLPLEYQSVFFGGTPHQMFLNNPGNRSVLAYRRGAVTELPYEVSNPRHIHQQGSLLYVVEAGGFGGADDNIVKIDLQRGTALRLFAPGSRNGINNLFYHQATNTLVSAELMAHQVLLMDPASGKLTYTLPIVDQYPRGLASLGYCLAVTSEDSRQVSFFDLRTPEVTEPIEKWDLSFLDARFSRARRIAVDPGTGAVYLRSTYICPTCRVTMSSVVMVQDRDGNLMRQCRG